jgi:hypothetical protein
MSLFESSDWGFKILHSLWERLKVVEIEAFRWARVGILRRPSLCW